MNLISTRRFALRCNPAIRNCSSRSMDCRRSRRRASVAAGSVIRPAKNQAGLDGLAQADFVAEHSPSAHPPQHGYRRARLMFKNVHLAHHWQGNELVKTRLRRESCRPQSDLKFHRIGATCGLANQRFVVDGDLCRARRRLRSNLQSIPMRCDVFQPNRLGILRQKLGRKISVDDQGTVVARRLPPNLPA